MEENKKRNHSHNIMTKNVTEFRHMIKNSYTTENDILWATNLRSYSKSPTRVNKDGSPPDVYHKKTEITQIREQQFLANKNKGVTHFNCSQFSHMVPKFNQKTLKQSQSAIQFFSSLRNYGQDSNKQSRTKFSTIPYKDKQQTPKLLKKVHLKKTRNLSNEDFETVEDGRQNYPHYTEKILKNRNSAYLKTFTSVRGRGQVSLPCLAWQVGLRSY